MKSEDENQNSKLTKQNVSEEDAAAWRQVKRKNKENKVRKESKVNNYEREDLGFYFDEEFDQEVPTGRQNTFSSDW